MRNVHNKRYAYKMYLHYENKPIQIYWKIYQQNMKKIR